MIIGTYHAIVCKSIIILFKFVFKSFFLSAPIDNNSTLVCKSIMCTTYITFENFFSLCSTMIAFYCTIESES